jgi:hypothetical protein
MGDTYSKTSEMTSLGNHRTIDLGVLRIDAMLRTAEDAGDGGGRSEKGSVA